MQKIAALIVVIVGLSLCGLYHPTSAAPKKDGDSIMDELLDVMRHYQLHNEDDINAITETTTPPLFQDVQIESKLNDACPNINLISSKHSDTTIATCTEVTYECVNKSHVLVVGGDGVCLNVDKTTRDCSTGGWDPTKEPFCSPVCTVEEEVGRSWTIQMPGSRLIGSNQVLPNSTVVFTCDAGELKGPPKLVCLEDGRFDADFPTCEGNTFNKTECGDGEWVRLAYLSMSDPAANVCPHTWIKASSANGNVTGCHSRIGGECSPFRIDVGSEPFTRVCGRAVGYQMGFPDAYAVKDLALSADSLYVDGLSITYGFPRAHVWTYAVAASRGTIYNTNAPTCPCQAGQPPPAFVGENYHCDSVHGQVSPSNAYIQENGYTVYSKIHTQTSLWGGECVCCNNTADPLNKAPWFVTHMPDIGKQKNTYFEVRLCEHEIDMQEGALISEFELYIQ